VGDIMSESMGGIISECPGDFIGIGKQGPDKFWARVFGVSVLSFSTCIE
jgi:hypothetical protein